MRLFVAIRFDQSAEGQFHGAVEALRERSVSGSFTRRENLHLTLAFLGEVADLSAAKQAVREVRAAPFDLTLGGLGRFRREGGDVCWIGVGDSGPLQALHRALCASLYRHGLPVDGRPYRPHLTLGRRVVTPAGFDPGAFPRHLAQRTVTVDTITLMESGRVQGVLTYTPLLDHKLAPIERTDKQ